MTSTKPKNARTIAPTNASKPIRILSGIQPSGAIHLGNYLGAIREQIERQNKQGNECFYFIADLHALTTVRDPQLLKQYTTDIALSYLALGLDPEKTVFFRQSDVPAHTELAWILSCIAPFGLLERAHAWKDAIAKQIKDPTVGLFTYPILMAADILLYKPNFVPVGKDQKQHVEIARDLALKFNTTFGSESGTNIFDPLPEPLIRDDVATVPGTDGQKMSKSYGNTIDIFAEEKQLQKQVMSIVTDSKGVDEPKDPNTCTVFKLYRLLATTNAATNAANNDHITDLEQRYRKGGLGYGEAKKLLFAKLLETFSPARKKRIELTQNIGYVERVLQTGAARAQKVAEQTLLEIRRAIGTHA